MPRVRVIHWKAAEAGPLLEACRLARFEVDYAEGLGTGMSRAIQAKLPDVVVIDLSRLPSHGREVAVWLRNTKATREIPIVFVGGNDKHADKVAKIRGILPDAHYCEIGDVPDVLKKVLSRGRARDPVAPPGMMQRASGKSAAQKLGIEAGARVSVTEPPRDFPELLGELPGSVEIGEGPAPITLWFIHDRESLLVSLRRMRAVAGRSRLWILWRKGSGQEVTQNLVRDSARDAGLVDYKICSVDPRWSAMLFALRKS